MSIQPVESSLYKAIKLPNQTAWLEAPDGKNMAVILDKDDADYVVDSLNSANGNADALGQAATTLERMIKADAPPTRLALQDLLAVINSAPARHVIKAGHTHHAGHEVH